jgi:hypothetical protein
MPLGYRSKDNEDAPRSPYDGGGGLERSSFVGEAQRPMAVCNGTLSAAR